MDKYKLVPVIPTEEMLEAGHYVMVDGYHPGGIYADMLAAAPSAHGPLSLSDEKILEIASNPMSTPCSPWWLKGDVKAGDVQNAAIAFAKAVLKAATPVMQGEPVAWVTVDTVDGQVVNGKPRRIWWENKEGVGMPIYATPQPSPTTHGEPGAWLPYLTDRADGVTGHYAIARKNPTGYREVWNLRSHRWAAFSDGVLTLDEALAILKKLEMPTAPKSSSQLPDFATDPDDSDEGASLLDHGFKRGWNECLEVATKTVQPAEQPVSWIRISGDHVILSRCDWMYPTSTEDSAGPRDEQRFMAVGRRDGDIVLLAPEGSLDREDMETMLAWPSATKSVEQQPDITRLVEALEAIVSHHDEYFRNSSVVSKMPWIKQARYALAAHRKGGEL